MSQKASTAVCLALYNGQTYLKEQLESIAAQSVLPDVLYIRDDGSTDSSLQIVYEFARDHPEMKIEVFKALQNEGYRKNFYELLKLAKEDWIFLCDQDDRWHPDKIETMLRIAKDNPQIGVLCSSFDYMNQNSRIYSIPLRDGWSNQNLYPKPVKQGAVDLVDFQGLIFHSFFQGCSMMISQTLLKEMLNAWSFDLPHDWLIELHAAGRNALFFYNVPLFDYRIHQANTTGLSEAKKKSLPEKFRQVNSWHYRTIVKLDSLHALKAIKECIPEMWDENLADQQRFFEQSLQALESRSLLKLWKLKNHPAYAAHAGKKGFWADCLFVLSHPMTKAEDEAKTFS